MIASPMLEVKHLCFLEHKFYKNEIVSDNYKYILRKNKHISSDYNIVQRWKQTDE